MRILYLDTSSSFLYCGLIENDFLVFGIKENYGRDLSKYTLYHIKTEFEKNSVSPSSVDKIILVNGPGSFTGIRIAVTIAKTFAWAFNIPIITISSLDAMAVSASPDKEYIVPIIDARRGHVFGAIYDKDANIVLDNQYIALTELKAKLNFCNGDFVFISNDLFDFECQKYSPDFLKIVNKYKNNQEILSHLVNANYLKLTEAEEKNNDKEV